MISIPFGRGREHEKGLINRATIYKITEVCIRKKLRALLLRRSNKHFVYCYGSTICTSVSPKTVSSFITKV
jgi:hypothetical protein